MLCLKNLNVLFMGDNPGTSCFEKVQRMFAGSQVSGTHPKMQTLLCYTSTPGEEPDAYCEGRKHGSNGPHHHKRHWNCSAT